MDEETEEFLDECSRKAAEKTVRPKTAEEITQIEREVAQIRLNGAEALGRLEEGQRQAIGALKHKRYRG